jgi:branched-chain amino acid transport system permease protein
VLCLLPLVTQSGYLLQAVIYAMIFTLLSASVTLVSGSIGILSIGHAGFYGVGAYAVAVLSHTHGLPTELALPCAALLTAAVATVAALPLARLSGHTAALGTLAIGQILFLVFMTWLSVTRGPMGFVNIPAPQFALLGGLRLGSVTDKFWLVAIVSAIGLFLLQRLMESSIGRVWRGIREDRLAAHVAGIPVQRYLLMGFAVSGLLAGTAGGLFAYVQNVVSPESFTVQASMLLLTMAVLGGLGNVTGAALAGFAYGLVLLLMLRWRPQGLLGAR